jgi:hypothetical protein
MTLLSDYEAGRMRQRSPDGQFQRKPLPLPAGNCFTRTLTANIVGHVRRETPGHVAARMWPSDRIVAEILERAASAPAMTSVAGWAAELAQKKIVDTLTALYPVSAAAALFAMGTSLAFDGAGLISVPGFVAEFGNKGFVAEGQPIPVHQLALSVPDQLKPTKLAGIVVLTREMIESSNAEQLISDVALRMMGRMLDEVLVDANPTAVDRPAGLRSGIAITPAEATLTGNDAFVTDMGNLAQAVELVTSNAPLAYVMSPGKRVKTRLWFANNLEPDVARVFASGATINDVLCIATAALVSAVGDPAVESSKAATLHMNDTPTADVGSASRHASMWQTDSIAIRISWPVSWIIRDPRGFAWTTPAGW